MRGLIVVAMLSALLACPGSARAQDRTFGGYECTQDCSGHAAGYRWAEEHGSPAMLEPDDTSVISRARAQSAYSNDRWREVRGLPAPPAAGSAEDLISAQRRAFQCLVEIIDTVMTGDDHYDFLLRRNMIEAARVSSFLGQQFSRQF